MLRVKASTRDEDRGVPLIDSDLSRPDPARPFRIAMTVFVVVLVLALFPYTGDPTGDVKDLVISWAAGLLTAGWLVVSWRTGLRFRPPMLFMPFLVLLLALHLAATFVSSYIGPGLQETRRLWALFLLYLLASQIYQTPDQARRLMLALCGGMLVASLYGFSQKAGLDVIPWDDQSGSEYRGLPATFGNPNYAAHALILTLVMAVYLALNRRYRWCIVFVPVFAAHLYFTHQRAGVLALTGALGLLVTGWLVRRWLARPAKAAALTLVIVAAAGIAGFLGAMVYAKLHTGSAYPLDASLLLRYNSYHSAARMAARRPLLGYGPEAYSIESPRFWTPYEQEWFARELKMNAHVHNDILEVSVSAGLIAGGLYLAFLIFAVGHGLLAGYTERDAERRRMGFMLAALFAAFLFDGCWGFNLYVPVSAAVLFLMAGVFEALCGRERDSVSPERLPATALVWRLAVIALALVAVTADSRVFASEVYLRLGERQVHRGHPETARRL
ncbi:MAG TPA: O-antigen ligase family protein, partial [Candidatus Hydrogenedentes bacterium]|nr:O-antigen ligase family protein [Candidatus Hydrogenedentota bacterium]